MNSRLATSTSSSPLRGFTLIELLITIAIAVIALAIGIPSFVTFQRNAELTSAANSVVAAVNAARGEAMKRNQTAYVVPASGSSWGNGFTVFIDKKTPGGITYTDGTDLPLTKQALNLPGYLTVSGTGATATAAAPFLRFNGSGYQVNADGSGFTSNAITIKRNDADTPKNTRNIMIARTGRVRVCTPLTSSDTNCTTTTLD